MADCDRICHFVNATVSLATSRSRIRESEDRRFSATDAAVAYDRKHEPEHDVVGPAGPLRTGRCQRRSALRR